MLDDAGRPVLTGLALRSLLVLLLVQAPRPQPLADLVAAVERAGFAFAGRPSKEVSDALRWEVQRGRATRLGRGLYGGRVAKSTRHRMQRRIADLRQRGRQAARAQV